MENEKQLEEKRKSQVPHSFDYLFVTINSITKYKVKQGKQKNQYSQVVELQDFSRRNVQLKQQLELMPPEFLPPGFLSQREE